MIFSFNISGILLRGVGGMDSSNMFSWRHQCHLYAPVCEAVVNGLQDCIKR